MRARGVLLLFILAASALAPTGQAWFWDCSNHPEKPECAKEPTPDESIIYAFGTGGHHALGFAADGAGVRDYESCFYAGIKPDEDYGNVVVAGLFNPDTPVDIRFEDWNNASGSSWRGIERDLVLQGARLRGHALPEIDVLAAGWGNATFEVGFEEYPDTVNGPPDADDAEWNWTAMFFLTRNGIRDNETKSMTNMRGEAFDPERPRDVRLDKGDWEAHLVLRNHTSKGEPWQAPFSIRGPDASTVRDDQYRAVHRLPNRAYGGETNIRIEVTAPTLLQTNLRFELLSPADQSLGNWTMGGTPLANDVRTFTLPLDQLLEYRFRVTGSLALAQYRISGTMKGPEDALLYFWWEDLSFGPSAVRQAQDCQGYVHGDLPRPAPLVVHTPDPKPLDVRLVFLGVAASLLIELYVVKLVLDSVSTRSFDRTIRKS